MEDNYQKIYKYVNQGEKDVNDKKFGFKLKTRQIRKDALKKWHKVYFLSEEEAYQDLLENKTKADINYNIAKKILESLPKNVSISHYLYGDTCGIYKDGIYIVISHNGYSFCYPYGD